MRDKIIKLLKSPNDEDVLVGLNLYLVYQHDIKPTIFRKWGRYGRLIRKNNTNLFKYKYYYRNNIGFFVSESYILKVTHPDRAMEHWENIEL